MSTATLERKLRSAKRDELAERGFEFGLDDPRLARMVAISHSFELGQKRIETANLADLGRILGKAPVDVQRRISDAELERNAKRASQVEAEMAQFWTVPLNAGTPSGSTTGAALTASTSLTDVSPGATAQAFAFAAGQIAYAGQTFRVTASGVLSATSTPTLLMGVYYGGVAGTALAATVATATGAQSGAPWFLTYVGRITSLGSGGAILGQGYVLGTAATPTTVTFMPAAPGSVSINTTTQNALTIGAQWGTNNASTLTCNQFVIEQLF